jgi:LysR family nitrogen assimilation transcriptional regulator
MDIRHLRYFVAVAEAGSFVGASRQLDLSQPALSSRVKELEAWAGTPLFQRIPRGVVLTESGDRLLPHARDVLSAMARAESAMAGDISVSLAMGVTPTPGVAMVPHLLAAGASAKPSFRIQIQQGASDELLDMVTRNRLQAALCYRMVNVEPLVSIPLYSEDLCLVGLRDTVDTAKGDISFDALADIPLILDPRSHATRRRIDEVAFRKKIRLDVRLEVEPANAKRAMMAGQGFCAVVPKALYADEIQADRLGWRRISDPNLPMTLSLVVNSSIPQKVMKGLLAIIEQDVEGKISAGVLGWRLPDPAIL